MENKTREETIKAWNEHIVGKTFYSFADLDSAIGWHVGIINAEAWLLSEEQKNEIARIRRDIFKLDSIIKDVCHGIGNNMYTMYNNINDGDYLYSICSVEKDLVWKQLFDIKTAMLRKKAILDDGVKIKKILDANPDYDENYEYDEPCIWVPNKHFEES
jgi:hypothetical protein